MKSIFWLFTVLCFGWSSAARADALVQNLPADGSWISFHVILKVEDQEVRAVWSIRSVGVKTVDGVPCRWIELESVEGPKHMIFKLQIPEKEFGKGKNPLGSARKVWAKFPGDAPAKEYSNLAEVDLPLSIIIEGPTADIKRRADKEPIKWQNGQFDSDVFEGVHRKELFGSKYELTHVVWKHADVPFGVTAMKQTLKMQFGEQSRLGKLDMSLKEFGKDAKSALPQVQ
ncbi:MAG: hypothetical protein JWM11_7410 [Planctomycetaceae bacterium]|nr:hypothetical protein [Planctomycetaceae bacterium]